MALDLTKAASGQVACTATVNIVSVMPQHEWQLINTGANDVAVGVAGATPTVDSASRAGQFTMPKATAGYPGVPFIITGVDSLRFKCGPENSTLVSMTRIK